MTNYKLVAFDMDGTLLNSKKQISSKTVAMIRYAAQKGKIIVLSTGRGVAELKEYMELLPEIQYLVCTSGALVYDCREKKIIAKNAISVDSMEKILHLVEKEEVMPHFLSMQSLVQYSDFEKMEEYQMGVYRPLFEKNADKCENIYQQYFSNPVEIEKLNLYHHSPEDRKKTETKIQEMQLPITMVYSEISSLEITAQKVDKGVGLLKLCEYLGLSPEETIAVGDADNDKGVLKVAGLSVAMGNAAPSIQKMADVVVSDCDHDGCAEVIEKYLLS